MGASLLTPIDFDGLSLTGTEFVGSFLVDFDIATQFPMEAVLSEVPADFPTFIRGDPQDKVIPLEITIRPGGAVTQTLIDELKETFSPYKGLLRLRVTDQDGNTRRMMVKSLGLTPFEGHSEKAYVASLEAPTPIWEDDSISSDVENAVGSAPYNAHAWNVMVGGNERVYPTIWFRPTVAKGNPNHFIRRWPITIAWRSDLEGVDSLGQPYPIDVVDGLFDSAAEIAAGRLHPSGTDLRLYVDGVEFDRYLEGFGTTGTEIWSSIAFQPAKEAELAATITAGNPPAGGTILVLNPEGTAGFPDSGIILIDSEAIRYSALTDDGFVVQNRGWNGTTAAGHAAFSTIYFVEHDILLVSNWANPTTLAPESADLQPMLDLAASSNSRHVYGTTEGLIAPTTLRTGQWLRQLRRTDAAALVTRLSQNAGAALVEDAFPAAGTPNFDSLSLYIPCLMEGGTLPTGSDNTFDYLADHEMRVRVIGVDENGFETTVLDRFAHSSVFPGARYVFGTIAYVNGQIMAPSGDIARLTIEATTTRKTGDWTFGTRQFTVAGTAAATARIAQGITIAEGTDFLAVHFVARKSAGSDRDLAVTLFQLDAASGPTNIVAQQFTIATADIPVSPADEEFSLFWTITNDQETPRIPAGTYAIVFTESGGAAGDVQVGGGGTNVPFYSGGSFWQESAGPIWTALPGDDLDVTVHGRDGLFQTDAGIAKGYASRFRNMAIELVDANTPAIVRSPAEDLYFIDGLLSNTTTVQALRVIYPVNLSPTFPLTEFISLDVLLRRVLYRSLTAGTLAEVPGAVEPESGPDGIADPLDWMHLDPGVNAMRWDEPTVDNGAGTLEITTIWRDRWS